MEQCSFDGQIVKTATKTDPEGVTIFSFVISTKLRTLDAYKNSTTVIKNLSKSLRITISGDQLDAFKGEN